MELSAWRNCGIIHAMHYKLSAFESLLSDMTSNLIFLKKLRGIPFFGCHNNKGNYKWWNSGWMTPTINGN